MGTAELFLLAVGLSMDAFAVSVCKGLSAGRVRLRHALTAGLWFGDADQVLEDIREKYGEENCQRILRGESSPVRADIVYTPKINRYNGFESIQLDISSFRW